MIRFWEDEDNFIDVDEKKVKRFEQFWGSVNKIYDFCGSKKTNFVCDDCKVSTNKICGQMKPSCTVERAGYIEVIFTDGSKKCFSKWENC